MSYDHRAYANELLARGVEVEVVLAFFEAFNGVSQLAHMMGLPPPETLAEWNAVFEAYQQSQVIKQHASQKVH